MLASLWLQVNIQRQRSQCHSIYYMKSLDIPGTISYMSNRLDIIVLKKTTGYYRHCPHRNRRVSVCLSRRSTAAAACGGFAAERRAGRRYRSTAAGAVQQAPALSSKCGQPHVGSRLGRLNTDLLYSDLFSSIPPCRYG